MVDYSYKGPVLFIDDELHIRLSAKQTLELAGFDVICLESALEALEHLRQGWPGIIISDIKMPKMDGLSFLEKAQEIDADIPIILITGHGDVSMAVHAMRDGAYDFLEKPFASEILIDTAARAMEKLNLIKENRELKEKLRSSAGAGASFLGKSRAIEQMKSLIENVADTDADVLITGETGTGKEMVARCLHENSSRRHGHFVALNCGAMPEHLFESELFGHEPGAFPGAANRRIGKIEYSSGGTLFLDEIETLPLSLQVKLLRVLQERAVERLGSNDVIDLNLRVLAASKKDLLEEVRAGNFREDLFYRLNVVMVQTPSLRHMIEDVPLLFQHFVDEARQRFNRHDIKISDGQFQALMQQSWPGNVRELKNTAERFVLGAVQALGAPSNTSLEMDDDLNLVQKMESYEKTLILQALGRTQGSIKDAMELLGLPRKTLSDKMKKYEIDRVDFVQTKS